QHLCRKLRFCPKYCHQSCQRICEPPVLPVAQPAGWIFLRLQADSKLDASIHRLPSSLRLLSHATHAWQSDDVDENHGPRGDQSVLDGKMVLPSLNQFFQRVNPGYAPEYEWHSYWNVC